MIFQTYQQKLQPTSPQQTVASLAVLSKSQSFRNTEESAKNASRIFSVRTMIKNTPISRPKNKGQQRITTLVKVPLYLRTGLQAKLKKKAAKDQDRDNLLDSLDLSASIWCLYDSESKKHVGFRQDCKREIASLTKIMTTIVSIEVIERLSIPLDLKIKVTNVSRSMVGTSAGLKANYWITLQDLLYGVMLPSGNDAAYAIAQYLGFVLLRSYLKTSWIQFQQPLDLTKQQTIFFVQQFIKAMNSKAKELNLKSTCFSNPHGLSNAMNTSSAKDIIKISRHSVKNSKFRTIMNTRIHQYALYQSEKVGKCIFGSWKNTNILLQKGWQGVKTGHTPTAGGCLSSLKDGIYIVILNSENDETRFSDTQKIYEWNKKRQESKTAKAIKRAVSEAAERKEGKQFTIRFKPITQISDYV